MKKPEIVNVVYDGQKLIGTITKGRPLKGGFPGLNAIDAEGRRIGVFPTRALAGEAILIGRRPIPS
jgi:hypothetical protein